MTKPINLGLGAKIREEVSKYLAALLADEYFLYLKTLNYHWNITGETFISLHELLEEHYEWLKDTVDAVAERIRALGHIAPGSYRQFCSASQKDDSAEGLTAKKMLEDLVESHEATIRNIRDALDKMSDSKDFATEDMLVKILGEHEQKNWMLRSHLMSKPE